MDIKQIEIRDAGTFIPALALRVSREDGYVFRRAGVGDPLVILIMLTTMECAYDPYDWVKGGRTMQIAHQHIAEHWDELDDEAVVDVEFILGETKTAKVSGRLTTTLD